MKTYWIECGISAGLSIDRRDITVRLFNLERCPGLYWPRHIDNVHVCKLRDCRWEPLTAADPMDGFEMTGYVKVEPDTESSGLRLIRVYRGAGLGWEWMWCHPRYLIERDEEPVPQSAVSHTARNASNNGTSDERRDELIKKVCEEWSETLRLLAESEAEDREDDKDS